MTDTEDMRGRPPNWYILMLGAVVWLFFPAHLEAKQRVNWHIRVGAELPQYLSPADQVEGATYTRRYRDGYVGNVGMGFSVLGSYIGVAYEHWFAGRATEQTTDWLRYNLIGLEVGYLYSLNPRMYLLTLASVYYPLECRIQANHTEYYRITGQPLSYQTRFGLGFMLNPQLGLEFIVGYRKADLGDFTRNSESYLGGQSFNVTGLLYGVTFAFHW